MSEQMVVMKAGQEERKISSYLHRISIRDIGKHTFDNHPLHIHRNPRRALKLTLCGVFDSMISEPISLLASGQCNTNPRMTRHRSIEAPFAHDPIQMKHLAKSCCRDLMYCNILQCRLLHPSSLPAIFHFETRRQQRLR